MQRRSKPERYTTDQVCKAFRLARGLVTVAARHLGCHPDTLREYCARHEVCAAALEESRDHILDIAEQKLYDAVERGEQWAIVFLLTRLGKHRGYTERQELQHTGAGGGPIVLQWSDTADGGE